MQIKPKKCDSTIWLPWDSKGLIKNEKKNPLRNESSEAYSYFSANPKAAKQAHFSPASRPFPLHSVFWRPLNPSSPHALTRRRRRRRLPGCYSHVTRGSLCITRRPHPKLRRLRAGACVPAGRGRHPAVAAPEAVPQARGRGVRRRGGLCRRAVRGREAAAPRALRR